LSAGSVGGGVVGVVAGELPAGKVATVVVDLDGVVYLDREGVPGAAAALQRLESAGVRLLFATNNSTKTPQSAAHDIAARTGFAASPESVVVSTQAAADHLAGRCERALVVGSPAIGEALTARGISTVEDWRDAQAVVVGLDRGLSYRVLAEATQAVRRCAAELVATNADATYPTPEGLMPGAGTVVAALETATGVTAVVTGKPHPPMRRLVRRLAGEGDIVVVGDRLETDIAMAETEGWSSALVLTGVTPSAPAPDSVHHPTVVLDSIADLPAALGW
jgi:glycerol 3-phosphatase-2